MTESLAGPKLKIPIQNSEFRIQNSEFLIVLCPFVIPENMLRFFIHYGIHFILPILIGWIFFREHRLKIILILLGGILIDVDHLWANPIFDANRCSIGYHFLHSYWAIAVYFVLFLYKPARIIGLALLIHILADTVDCWLMV